jgi:peptide/nickel transport system substrate-binding protein
MTPDGRPVRWCHLSTAGLRRLAASATIGMTLIGGTGARPADGQTPRPGGTLVLTQWEDPPDGFAIHETSTISTLWPAMPCFSNLVLFDPLRSVETQDTIVGELAERWAWRDGHRALVFFLRKGVRWHDGRAFSSRDVKATFDLVREAPETPARLRINPRKDWYANVLAVEAPDPHTVVFQLRRPQPSLLSMLATGYGAVYAAHVPPERYRTECLGTGPFRLREWRRGGFIDYVRNPDYFVRDRPYLDSVRYLIIADRRTRLAALQTGQVDAAFPTEWSRSLAEELTRAVPRLTVTVASANVYDNLVFNVTRPPFNDPRTRRALSHAIDRRALVAAVHHGGAVLGAAMAPPPHGVWGLAEPDLAAWPGYGRPEDDKTTARRLLAEAGFDSGRPLRVEMVTRNIPGYLELSAFVISELRKVGVEATLRPLESGQLGPLLTRGEFQVAVNLTGLAPDDPDANLYENFSCGSPRNYGHHCSDVLTRLIEEQSRERDGARRLALVHAAQRTIEEEAARAILAWRLTYYAAWPHVRNLVPHQSAYNWGRMQEVWRDR